MKQVDGVYVTSAEEITIFESPDGGKTIYARKSGSSEKTLIREDVSKKELEHWLEWRDILETSKDHPGLKELIDKAEMFYRLVKEEK